MENRTNQIFVILSEKEIEQLSEKYGFELEQKTDESHYAVRFCTSWATKRENVEKLKEDLRGLKS